MIVGVSCVSNRDQEAQDDRSDHAAARSAQHATGKLDNRHVEIVCAASVRVNVSVLYQFVDSANRLWPTNVAPRRVFSPVGQRVARSLPERWPAVRSRGKHSQRLKAINSRTGGAAWSLPLLIGSGNGRQDARPCFARLPVAVLRNLRLGRGSSRFWLGLFCARCIRDARRSL